jgi:hypothetical protein
MAHTDFSAVFRAGAAFESRTIRYTMEVEPLGDITTQGGLLLFDPVPDELGGFGRAPFARTVPPGTYAVDLALARNVKHPESVAVAALRVRLKETRAVRWEPAPLDRDQDPRPWGEDPGVRVLAGAIAIGGEAARGLWVEEPPEETWAVYELEEGGDAIVVDVGEGLFPAYWGLDANAEVCELCIDTALLTRAVWRDVPLSLPLQAEEVAAASAFFSSEAGVTAHLEAPFVLRLEGDVRRFWYGRVVNSRGEEIGSSFAPKASGNGPELRQRYDCTPYLPHGGVGLRVRMVFPDEPLPALES